MKTVERNLFRISRTRGVRPWTQLIRYVAAVVASAIVVAAAPAGAATAPRMSADALARVAQIRAEVDARYRGLRVSDVSSTSAIDSLTLFDGVDPRVVSAGNRIYYAVCPNGASCPIPGRAARPAAALAPRRVALELAVRSFLETPADLVLVSLPTPRFILLVFERGRRRRPSRERRSRRLPGAH